MKRSTAIRHLVEIGETASEHLRLRGTDIGWPLEELWAAGDLLTPVGSLDRGSVVMRLDLSPEDLPWMALDGTGEWIGAQLRLGKRPMLWCYRPLTWPPWNHQNRRVVQFWSAASGLDTDVIDQLSAGAIDELPVIEPSPDALADQLRSELGAARRHLRAIVDGFWDREWRSAVRSLERPDDHLWRAAAAVCEIEDALDTLDR